MFDCSRGVGSIDAPFYIRQPIVPATNARMSEGIASDLSEPCRCLLVVGSTAACHVDSHHPTAMAKIANKAMKVPTRAAPLSMSDIVIASMIAMTKATMLVVHTFPLKSSVQNYGFVFGGYCF